MHTYYLRTTDMPSLIALGVKLGALEPLDGGGVTATQGGTWAWIGPLPDRSRVLRTADDGEPVYDVLRGAGGEPMQHANLLTPLDLASVAAGLALAAPDIAAALERVPEFFVTDASGRARAPSNPALTFWSAATEGSTT